MEVKTIMELYQMIEAQQKGQENTPAWMIGEQLKEIAAREPASAELLEQDLANEAMSLKAAAKKLQEYADKHRGSARAYCITPQVAEGILREFYGLPKAGEAPAAPAQQEGYIDLSAFL